MCSAIGVNRGFGWGRTSIFNVEGHRVQGTMEKEHYCPSCDEEQTFSLMASEQVHLGKKTKWWCKECGYEMVLIGDSVDMAAAQA